ncbi:hypothetical protein BDZ97DRAFT_1923766 [Flammula alnicola]|nr:hypothetical protein BDZ97DRAFT_1923766 [Flammula alnicola]
MPPTVMPPTIEGRPKWDCKMSRWKRCALNLPSDSAGSLSSPGDRESDEVEDGDLPATPTPLMLQPLTLDTKADDEKHAKFDECYKTATSSDEEVLKKQIYQWIFNIYKHFEMPPTITVKKGIITYIFTCVA